MKYLKGFLALIALSIAYLGTGVYLESQSFTKPRQYVQLITDGQGTGSIIVIAPGLALTAAHVAQFENLKVNGEPIKVLKIDHNVDLALIQAKVDCPCAPIGVQPQIGDELVAVGFSNGEMEFATKGQVQGWADGKIYSNTAIVFGNSGGGLFAFQDLQWKLVGVTVQVSGTNAGFMSIPVFHMVRSVDINLIKDFIGYSTR